MGYPMTFQRFLNRNRLQDGDYRSPPTEWTNVCGQRPYVRDAFSEHERRTLDQANEEREDLARRISFLAGDLRRLERDAADESATCAHIAARTGIDQETVAAVLKEFVSW